MNDPRGLAVDSEGYIFVADRDNDRILVLNSTLSDVRTLSLSEQINGPWGLWLDESRGRLYVGEFFGQKRLLVFDNVFNLSAAFTP